MTTIESCRSISPLTRFARAMARLAGIGACLGIGASTLLIWERFPAFVENNQISMARRIPLLQGFFVPLLVLPTLVALWTLSRGDDPRRLFTLESLARRLTPLTVVGLLPPLLHPDVWQGHALLFLVATLLCTLIAYGSLRHVCVTGNEVGTGACLQPVRALLPERLARWAPWLLLVVAMVGVCVISASHGAELPVRAPKAAVATTFRRAMVQLGHGGILAVPFVMWTKLCVGSSLHRFIQLVAVAAAALPLYAWARLRLGRTLALAVAAIYLSFPPLVSIGAGAPLPLGVAAGLFFLAAWGWETRRWTIGMIATALMLLIHEQTAVWLVCLGSYWLLQGRRGTAFVPVLLLVLVGYFACVGFLWLPSLGIEPYGDKFRSLWAASTPGMGPALLTLVTNPARALFRWCEQRDLLFYLAVLVPFALVPFKNSMWLLWLCPFAWFGVIATGHAPGPGLTEVSVSHFVVLGFVAAVVKIEQLKRGVRPGLAWATVLTWVFALIPCISQSGCLWLQR